MAARWWNNLAKLESTFVRGMMIGGIVLGSVVLLFLYWLVRPYDLLHVYGDPVLVNLPDDGTYSAGDTVAWQRELICNYGTGAQRNLRWIENAASGVAIQIASTEFPQPAGDLPVCVEDNVTKFVIPPDAVRDGMWRFRTDISYKPNPVRVVTITTYSPWFTIADS